MSIQEFPKNEDAASFEFWLRFWRWVIVAEQVTGGLFGLCLVAQGWASTPSHLVFALAAGFFLLAITGGVLLALNKPQGVMLSLVVQAFQLIQISNSGLLFMLFCGARLLIGSFSTEDGSIFGFDWGITPAFWFVVNPPALADSQPEGDFIRTVSERAFTGINVLAFLAIICLLYLRKAYRLKAALASNAR